jgi:hypothetical protein
VMVTTHLLRRQTALPMLNYQIAAVIEMEQSVQTKR